MDRDPEVKHGCLKLAAAGLAAAFFVGTCRREEPQSLNLPEVAVATDPSRFDPAKVSRDGLFQEVSQHAGYLLEYLTPENPENVVIQIDVVHGVRELGGLQGKLAPVQERCKLLVEAICERYQTRYIYHDGITEQNVGWLTKHFAAYRKIQGGDEHRNQEADKTLSLDARSIATLRKRVDSICEQCRVFELAKDDHYIFRPAESHALLMAASKLDPRSDARASANDSREQFIVENIIREQSNVSVVVLGATHDLKDNIARWNEEHPNQTIAYFRVRPNGMPETKDIHELARWTAELLRSK